MEKKIKHLELIQITINRFSTNSFQIKGWSILIVSALFALAASDANPYFAFLAYVPSVVFWGLDGYYLSMERLYRKLYEIVRKTEDDDIDFSMNTKGLNEKKHPWVCATLSKTLIPFHCSILIAIIIVMFSLIQK